MNYTLFVKFSVVYFTFMRANKFKNKPKNTDNLFYKNML